MESFMGNLPDARSRLLLLSAQRGVSLSALSGVIGRNASYLQQFVRKGSPRKLEENDRRTLARYLGVEESELGAPPPAALPAGTPSRRRSLAEWLDIPRLGLGASAGPGAMTAAEDAVGQLRFSARWLKDHGLEPGALSVIAVEGDSMEPTLRDGDEILVDRSVRGLRAGVHVIRLDDVLLVKRLEPAAPGRVTVISDNPAYGRSERAFEELEIVGRVVWKGGRL